MAGTIVEDGNLTVQIAALRKTLGEGSDGQDWIATVPRVGYRLVRRSTTSAPSENSRPALAVLPFQSHGGKPGEDYFADGIVDDIITALGRFRSFAVIAGNSSFTYKGRTLDVRVVAQELGIRYVLEGSVRRAGDRLRITALLVDGQTGKQLWAQNFDGSAAEVFDFQDAITQAVACIVEPSILDAEIERARRQRTASLTAYDLMLRALPGLFSADAEDNARACGLLDEALAIEPDNPAVVTRAGVALSYRLIMGWSPIGPDDRRRCIDLTRKGLRLANGDATLMALCADALMHVAGDYDVAMAAVVAATAANPNDYVVVRTAGVVHLHCGEVAEALAYFHRALTLSPRNQAAYIPLCGIAHAHLIAGDLHRCLDWAVKSHVANPRFEPTLWMLIAANAHLGRKAEASSFLSELRAISPAITIARIAAGQPAKDVGRIAPILEGLRLAGLPEH